MGSLAPRREEGPRYFELLRERRYKRRRRAIEAARPRRNTARRTPGSLNLFRAVWVLAGFGCIGPHVTTSLGIADGGQGLPRLLPAAARMLGLTFAAAGAVAGAAQGLVKVTGKEVRRGRGSIQRDLWAAATHGDRLFVGPADAGPGAHQPGPWQACVPPPAQAPDQPGGRG